MSAMHRMRFDELESLILSALHATGANPATVTSLTRATLSAEARRKSAVGAVHLLDYIDAISSGRLNRDPQPKLYQPRPGVITVDADTGIAQLAFDQALPELDELTTRAGVGVLSIHNSFSGGELGYYVARAAEKGLVALACGNSAALMAVHGAHRPVTGTNPLAFALPHVDGPRLFDQAASATAWVKVREAAEAGQPLPDGYAIDAEGEPTTDARAARSGALLPFGGVKGGNIALMIEFLATLAGGSFSLDASPFSSGDQPPRLGVFVLTLDPTAFDPDYLTRAEAHLARLAREHGVDFARRRPVPEHVEMSREAYHALTRLSRGG